MDVESVPLKQNVSSDRQQYAPQNPAMGCPPPYASPPGGQQYYPQPGVVYHGPPGSNYQGQKPQELQQQPQLVLVSNQPAEVAPAIVAAKPVSMVGPIILSCIVSSCCGWLCGGIAFILAMVGQCSANDGKNSRAVRLRAASYMLSIVGIIVGVIVIGIYLSYAYKN